jgi:hypothetical protein
MKLDVQTEVAVMERMTMGQLQKKYTQVFGEDTRSRHKRYLIRRIAWRMQANAEGGLSERARQRAEELADDAEIRVTPPREKAAQHPDSRPASIKMDARRDPRLPPPGNWIEREYKGRTVRVLVVEDGFEYDGRRYQSLSAIAKAVTGSHINGYLFFRLRGDQ